MPTLFKMLQGMQAKYDAVPIVTSRNLESKKKKQNETEVQTELKQGTRGKM